MGEHIITQGPRISQVSVVDGKPAGYQQITSLSSATGLTVPKNANVAIVQVEGAPIRWRDDGTDPTSSVGMLLYPGNVVQLNVEDQLANFSAIQTATGGKLNVSYYEKS